MDWDNAFLGEQTRIEKQIYEEQQQELANQVLAGIMQDAGTQMGQLGEVNYDDPNYGRDLANRQRGIGASLLQSLSTNPNLRNLDTNRAAGLMTNFLKMQNAPDEFAAKEWERRQTAKERMEQQAANQAIQIAQRAGEQRSTQEQKLEADKRRQEERLQQQRDLAILMENLRQNGREDLARLVAGLREPKEPKIIQDDKGAYQIVGGKAVPLEGVGGKGRGAESTPGQVFQAKNYTNKLLSDVNSYDLTPEEYDEAVKNKLLPKGRKLKPEVLSDINQGREMVGLPPLQEVGETGKEWSTFAGIPVPGTTNKKPFYRYSEGQPMAPTAPPTSAQAASAPQGGRPPITEADIQFTAKKYGMTREQVLKKLGLK